MQTIRPLSTQACALSGLMVCIPSVVQFCCCFIALGLTVPWTQCADHPATHCTGMCTQWPYGLHTKCSAVLLLLYHFGPHIALHSVCSVQTIRPLSTQACAPSGPMVCIPNIVQFCCCAAQNIFFAPKCLAACQPLLTVILPVLLATSSVPAPIILRPSGALLPTSEAFLEPILGVHPPV